MADPESPDHAGTDTAVIVADGDPTVRSALRLVLSQATGVRTVSEAGDADALLVDAAATTPDIVLLDWSLPGSRSKDIFAALHACAPGAVVVVISTRPEARVLATAAGADGFLCKSDDPALLIATLRRLVQR
jgi:DNA-binding NarL/FixJ family response regulator